MKKIFVAILTIVLMFTLCACGQRPGTGSPGGSPHMCEDFIDPETGVHYLVVEYSVSYGFGLSPRYNSDGTLMVEPRFSTQGR